MTDNEQKKVFAKNLNNLLIATQKTQKEVADVIGVSPQTFNTWCVGIALPRMGKIQKLADYFHIDKSDLIDDKTNTDNSDSLSKFDLNTFKQLSDNNINKVNNYAQNLLNVQTMEDSLLNAAHLNKDATQEAIEHDDNIMKNDF